MKLLMIKSTGGVLLPADEDTIETLNKVKNGDEILIEYKPKRNVKFHRKLFALLKLILSNQEHYKTIDNILEVVKFKSGHFETIVTHKGQKHYKTKSISFAELDNAEFEEFYGKALDVAFELTSLDEREIEKQLIHFM